MPEGKVFLSYRRDDTAGHAGRVYDRLNLRFPGRIFMDVSGLEPGVDFVDEIERAVGSCQALIALIGQRWLTITDEAGNRRLDDPDDFVRLEIATALRRKIRVIPALISGAAMPDAGELPPDLATLARRNAVQVTEQNFDHDMERVIQVLEKELGEPPEEAAPKRAKDPASDLAQKAKAAIEVEDWVTAIQALQAALSLNPNDVELAARLRSAHRQHKLAGVYARGQKLYESGDKRGALEVFRQVRVTGGNYKDIDSLIALLERETAPPPPPPPKPKRLRWILGGAAAAFALLVIAGLYYLVDEFKPNPVEPTPAPSVQPLSDRPRPYSKPERYQPPPEPASPAAPFFEPIGRWLISDHASPGVGIQITLRATHDFSAQTQAGALQFPASAGRWSYSESERELTLAGVNIQGVPFSLAMHLDSKHEDHYHISVSGFLTQQTGILVKQ